MFSHSKKWSPSSSPVQAPTSQRCSLRMASLFFNWVHIFPGFTEDGTTHFSSSRSQNNQRSKRLVNILFKQCVNGWKALKQQALECWWFSVAGTVQKCVQWLQILCIYLEYRKTYVIIVGAATLVLLGQSCAPMLPSVFSSRFHPFFGFKTGG